MWFHGNCNVELWNESNRKDAKEKRDDIDWKKAQAFHSVITYVVEKMADDRETCIPVKELNQYYVDNLKELGVDEQCQTTRFAEKLIRSVPNLIKTTVDSKLYVMQSQKVEELVSSHVKCPDTYLASLQAVAHPIRMAIDKLENQFIGQFDSSSQIKSVPKLLLLLIMLLIDGSTSTKPSQAVLSVAQMITYHARTNRKIHKNQKHRKQQETPLMIYTGLKIFFLTRSRQLIDGFFKAGLSVSYDRVLEVTKTLYHNLQEAYLKHGCFFPKILKKNLFSVWLKDNIDVNPKANFAKSSYHGTSSSMIQFVTKNESGIDFPNVPFENQTTKSKKLTPLPPEYTTVENSYDARGKSAMIWAPKTPGFKDLDNFLTFECAVSEEFSWLIHFNALFDTDTIPNAWSSYHAAEKRSQPHPPGINAILPVLRDKVHTLNTQAHIMKQNIKWTETLNPGQTPVDVSDQPVYALTKTLQYMFPDEFSNYFALFGQLHVEQALLVIHGILIKGSGLCEILTQNKFSTIGMSAAVDVNNIKRARYALQLSLCALFSKLEEAAAENSSTMPAYEWLCQKAPENEVYLYWKMVMELEISILIYVRSIREGNFKLYIETLRKLLKWFFIFDRYNYARWLTVQWFDLKNLESNFPDVYGYFCQGFFSFQKTDREFSQIGLDQVHEQNNAVIKGSGGATDLLNKVDESALLRWEVCNPELARLLLEFEEGMNYNVQVTTTQSQKHHEDTENFRKNFVSDVKILCKGFAMNPFLNDKLKRINNSKISFPEKSVENLKCMESKGENDVVTFINDRLVTGTTSVCETIECNMYDLWNESPSKKEKVQHTPSKSILNKMKSACEHRPDMALELFENEIMNIPQSLTPDGVSLYHGTKADIAKRFESEENIPEKEGKSAIILEMSPIIRAKACSSGIECFSDFAVIIHHHVMKLSHGYDRIDLIFDRYFEGSLKDGTRNERGTGSMFVFEGDDTPIPNNMEQTFMKESKNKNSLNEYLATKLIELHSGSQLLIATLRDTVLCSFDCEPLEHSDASIKKCQAEEADQRVVRHVLHLIGNYDEFDLIVINTIDTDVLILLISFVGRIENINPSIRIYAYLTAGKKFYNISEIARKLGKDVCVALLFFYCFTGCDTVSSLTGKGKCKALDTWFNAKNKDELTLVFKELGNQPEVVSTDQMEKVIGFIYLLYGVAEDSLGAHRVKAFLKSTDDDLRKLPPSRAALEQHVKRSCYQAGYLWQESESDLILPNPTEWGWRFDEASNGFVPRWSSSKSSVDLEKFITTCSCKTAKCKRCKCAAGNMACIRMCGCDRKCEDGKKSEGN